MNFNAIQNRNMPDNSTPKTRVRNGSMDRTKNRVRRVFV